MSDYIILNSQTHEQIVIPERFWNVALFFLNDLETEFNITTKNKPLDDGHHQSIRVEDLMQIYRTNKPLAIKILDDSLTYNIEQEELRKKQNRYWYSMNGLTNNITVINRTEDFEQFRKIWMNFLVDIKMNGIFS